MFLNPPTDSTYLCNMAVKDGYRRRGIASHMLLALEDYARMQCPGDTVYLHLRLRDKPAGELYRSASIRIVR
jgi:ribosomal protein S18 acetylase RimI-like enzyme